MANKYTLHDIALRAGVGDGTVSRVLNNHPNVSQKTRDKVLKAMADLDYRPNFSARHMRTQRSQLIGFLTDVVATTPFAGQIIQGAQEAAWREKRILLVVNTDNDPALTETAIEVFLQRDVEGIVYAAMSHRAVTLPGNVGKVPVALANCFDVTGRFSSVVPDEERGGYEATAALLAKGHRRIGMINFAYNPLVPASVGRQEGYRAALAEAGIAFDPALVYHNEDDLERGYRGALHLLDQPDPATAIFCVNDRTALGVYHALQQRGKRIPEDVAVISYDDQVIIAGMLRPSLTSMALPHRAMGQWAVEELFRLMEADPEASGPEPLPRHTKLHCPIVERESC